MSGSKSVREIDAKGLPCPQPVVLAKKAFEEGGFDLLKIAVDNNAAEENLKKLAQFLGAPCLGRDMQKDCTMLSFGPAAQGGAAAMALAASCSAAEAVPSADSAADRDSAGGAADDERKGRDLTVFIPQNRIGGGDDELGQKLMQGFLYALAEGDERPGRIVFMNSGVRLLVRDSKALESVKRLEKDGVDIVACGTCVDFYRLKDDICAGRISNMYDIAGFLCAGRTLTV